MNRAQRQVVWSGAVFALLLGFLAVRELSKPGLTCKDDIVGWVDSRGRWVQAKMRNCK